MKLLAIDPGPTQSAFVVYDGDADMPILDKGIVSNEAMLDLVEGAGLSDGYIKYMAVEMVGGMGQVVGDNIFETCLWIGRFIQAWDGSYTLIKRYKIKMHLCGRVRSGDPEVRRALIRRLGEPGIKARPGKTYGIANHMWAALGVAVTWAEKREFEARLK